MAAGSCRPHEKAGHHAFRRFKLTWLRENKVPSDLERFWMGHVRMRQSGTTIPVSGKTSHSARKLRSRLGLGSRLRPQLSRMSRESKLKKKSNLL
jgi:hypothetical protein